MKHLLVAALLSALALVTACGDDDAKTNSSTSGAGTSGTGTSAGALTGTCATLKDCCPKVTDMSSQNGCNFALANCGNNQGVCTDTLKNYTMYCP